MFAVIAFLAVFVEGTISFIFGEAEGPTRKWLPYVSLGLGVVLSIAYQVDILAEVFGVVSPVPFVGYVITGVIIGRGSNYANDLIGKLRK